MNGITLAKEKDYDKIIEADEKDAVCYEEKKLSAYSMAAVAGSLIINAVIVLYAVISAIFA